MILPSLVIQHTKQMGRGVFAANDIPANTIIEISPVVVMSGSERKLLDQTLLHDYIFEWGEKNEHCCMALGYIAVYNHSYESNCEYEMDFEEESITITTMKDVKAGEELFINYNGDWNNDRPVWFETK